LCQRAHILTLPSTPPPPRARARESGRLSQRTGLRLQRYRQSLFRARQAHRSDEKQESAKLIKVISLVQAHLSRDQRDQRATASLMAHLEAARQRHRQRFEKVLAALGGNPEVVAFLRKELGARISAFHAHVIAASRQYGQALLQEGKDAEHRLRVLTQSAISELASETAHVKRESKEEAALEAKDPTWAAVARQAAAKHKRARAQTRDELDEEAMIASFKDRIDIIPTQPSLTPREMERGMELLALHAVNDGEVVQGAVPDGQSLSGRTAKLGEIEAEMQALMAKAGAGAAVPGQPAQQHAASQFAEFMKQAEFGRTGGLKKMQHDVALWKADKMTDAQVMLEIQRQIAGGQVDPQWVLDKETKREKTQMMKLGRDNHANHHVMDRVKAHRKGGGEEGKAPRR
jgi:hypothetical protein